MSIDRLLILFFIFMDLKFWTVEFWKNIGYGLGSSSYLVQRLVQIADILNVSLIVELGAGQ